MGGGSTERQLNKARAVGGDPRTRGEQVTRAKDLVGVIQRWVVKADPDQSGGAAAVT